MARKTTSTTTKATPRKKSSARKEVPAVATFKPRKPMFSAGTWIAVLLLAGLIGFAFYLNREKKSTVETTPTIEETGYVFTANEGKVSSIEIKPADASIETFRMARNEKNDWVIELPIAAEADQGLAEGAASEIFTMKVIGPIVGKPDIFGFDNPAYTFTIEFDGKKTHTLEIGDTTPTNSGYYARVDKDKMMIIDMDGINYLLQNRTSPPYLNTPAPEVTVTPTP